MAVGFGFCSSCGAPLTKAQQKFCGVCGATLPVHAPAPEAAPPTPVQPTQPAQPPAQPPAFQPAQPPAPEPPTAPSPWAQTPPPPSAPAQAPQWQANTQSQTPPAPPPWSAGPGMPSAPLGAPMPPASASGAPAKSGLGSNPMLVVVGLVVIVAIAVGGYMAMNNHNHTPTGPVNTPAPTLASASAGPTETATPVATPTRGAGVGTVAVTPAKFACDTPGSATLRFTLPASIDGNTEISLTIDDTDAGSQNVSTLMTQKADGSWTASQDDLIANLCSEYGTGTHVVKILDPDDNILAQTNFTITGAGPTPTPAKAGGVTIVVQPGLFSCSTAGLDISMAIVLPASIDPEETVTLMIDEQSLSSDTVSGGFEQQSDGTWLSSGTIAASDLCALGTGSHLIKLVDGNGKVLGQASYTAQP
jgi:hypothetical protein